LFVERITAYESKGDNEKATSKKLRDALAKFDIEHATHKYFKSDVDYASLDADVLRVI